MTTIGVTGATGKLGRLVLQHLSKVDKDYEVVALVRDMQKAKELNVIARQADYNDTEALEQALLGIDRLLLISGNAIGQRLEQHRNVIAAAKKVGVNHIVYTSLLGADTSTLNLADEHVLTEKELKASGITYTILRNGWYTENYTDSLPQLLPLGIFYGSAKDGRIASATRNDYAQAAANVLTTSGHEFKTYELAGSSFYTLAELAQEVSEYTNKDFVYEDLSQEAYTEKLVQMGLDYEMAQAIASWDVAASQGALFSEDKTLQQLLNRPTTSLKNVISELLN